MDNTEFDKMVEQMSKPKYGGIDGFFAVVAVILVAVAVPIVVKMWQWAF